MFCLALVSCLRAQRSVSARQGGVTKPANQGAVSTVVRGAESEWPSHGQSCSSQRAVSRRWTAARIHGLSRPRTGPLHTHTSSLTTYSTDSNREYIIFQLQVRSVCYTLFSVCCRYPRVKCRTRCPVSRETDGWPVVDCYYCYGDSLSGCDV